VIGFARPIETDGHTLRDGERRSNVGSRRRPRGRPGQSGRALLAAYCAAGAGVALQAGDLTYYDLPYRTYFIAGNSEDLDAIGALRRGDASLDGPGLNDRSERNEAGDQSERPRLLAGSVAEIGGLRVAGLSGNYASTQYEKSRNELVGDRRRHFTHDDVDRLLALADADVAVDVFLAHEAPHGLIDDAAYEVGCKHIDAVLDALSPRLCLIGHYHRHAETTFGATEVVSLAPVWESYYRLDPRTLALSRFETTVGSA
jgi:hypothetical protein